MFKLVLKERMAYISVILPFIATGSQQEVESYWEDFEKLLYLPNG